MHRRFSRSRLLVLLHTVCLTLIWPATASAILVNPSFDGAGGSLTGWTTFNNVIPNVLAEPITPLDGSHVAKIFGGFNGDPNYSGLQQNQGALPGQVWTASAYVRHNTADSLVGTPNSLIMKIEFYRVPGGAYGTSDMLLEVGIPVLNSSSPLDTWTLQTLQAQAPSETVEARIVFVFEHVGFASGAALVDSVTFESGDPPPPTPGELVWEDEFDGPELDPASWEMMIGDGTFYGLPAGWGNNELQYYTDRPENVFVADGLLHIVVREEQFEGYDYTSARLRTQNRRDFLYGRMEACIQLPTGQGMWPAFWMLPTDWVYGGWASSGEIDIMEAVNIPTTIYGTIHYGGSWPDNTSSGGTYANGTNYADGFHVYAIDWGPDQIRWYVDDLLYHVETSNTWFSASVPQNPKAPFDQLFHFLINIAVGGNWPGPPDGSTVFPQEMLVDWVRVYQAAVPCPADLDGSGEVDASDVALLLGNWGPCPGCAADLNDDDSVNAIDLAGLLGNWGLCQ